MYLGRTRKCTSRHFSAFKRYFISAPPKKRRGGCWFLRNSANPRGGVIVEMGAIGNTGDLKMKFDLRQNAHPRWRLSPLSPSAGLAVSVFLRQRAWWGEGCRRLRALGIHLPRGLSGFRFFCLSGYKPARTLSDGGRREGGRGWAEERGGGETKAVNVHGGTTGDHQGGEGCGHGIPENPAGAPGPRPHSLRREGSAEKNGEEWREN